MPSSCPRCCCAVRSGQQVLMCADCHDIVHVRCLPVSAEEADRLASQIRWQCVVCDAKRTAREEALLLEALERRQEIDERVNGLLERLIALQHEQNGLSRDIGDASAEMNSAERRLSDADRELSAIETQVLVLRDSAAPLSKNDLPAEPDEASDSEVTSGRAAKTPRRKVSLTNLGNSRSRSIKTQRMPKMSLSLGHIISQLIVA
ncbi:Hypothetical protein NTJ_01524 [Nesidiocoris tenuis]|uniref:PHD-type domain-containing protein n=1 Tax=Nesidiocoris tenuis TaxID=355587 RepID=A0ABN7AEL5_9HEMI|nr:Hypothetical protein NTJ_01524 [Nesidiocoris tenuis]